MCLYSNDSFCSHAECNARNFQYTNYTSNFQLISSISQSISSNQEHFSKIIENNKILLKNLDKLSEKIIFSKSITSENLNDYPNISSDALNSVLFENQDFQYSIHLINELPSVILKEKGFEVVIGLFDSSLKRIQIPFQFKFYITLYTDENPPKLLESNIHGKKIMRGTLNSFTNDNWVVVFKNVVINEVSSHYPNDNLSISISHSGTNLIRPLLLKNIAVKARKNN